MTNKDQLNQDFADVLESGGTDSDAIRRVFLFNSPSALRDHGNEYFQIFNSVAQHFQIPFSSVQLAGSAQTGYSYIKDRDFVLGESDLDLAIVDVRLFSKYFELVYSLTDMFADLTKFKRTQDGDNATSFQRYVARGMFRPDLMPQCPEKQDWFSFFNQLGTEYVDIFQSINCGIYLSEAFFTGKQTAVLDKYKEQSS